MIDAPWPAMMPDRMGTIGSTQGVKASSSPSPKNVPSTTSSWPEPMSLARRSCSETNAPGGVPATAVPAPAGRVTVKPRVSGG